MNTDWWSNLKILVSQDTDIDVGTIPNDGAKGQEIVGICKQEHEFSRKGYELLSNLQKNGKFSCHICNQNSGNIKCSRSLNDTEYVKNYTIDSDQEIFRIDETGERWVKLSDKCRNYIVSDIGRVRHLKNSKDMKPETVKGYLRVVLSLGSRTEKIKCLVHRLVAICFLAKEKRAYAVDHIDRNKLNNHCTNLRWASCKENGVKPPEIKYNRGVKIEKINAETGEVKKVFNSITECCSELGISSRKLKKIMEDKIEFDQSIWRHKSCKVENEQWRVLKKSDQDIDISTSGNLKTQHGIITKGSFRNNYYMYNSYLVSRLVAEAFLEIPENPENYIVNHKNGNTKDNCVENLEWMSHSENSKHAVNLSTHTHSRPVDQYLKGKIIAHYPSTRKASDMTLVKESNMWINLNGKSGVAGGFTWKYSDNPDKEIWQDPDLDKKYFLYKEYKLGCKPVTQYKVTDSDNTSIVVEYMADFDSIVNASKASGVSESSIRRVLNGEKTHKYFWWEYKVVESS